MLKISITGSDGENLTLAVDGKPNNGRSSASRKEEVFWVIEEGTDVREIEEIAMKDTLGTEDIFKKNPPAPQNEKKTTWKGKINNDAEIGAVYVYFIKWIKTDGSSHIFDPIISVKPN